MKKPVLFLVFILLATAFGSLAQQPLRPEVNLPSLTPDEQLILSAIPLLELPDAYRGSNAPLLPVSVDNSTQPYFRPITSQAGLECGQNAGICFNFTYEMDRLKNIPANTLANQFPSHFAWNFLNSGTNMGVACFDSWEIVRGFGTPTAADYGGLTTGGPTRWINGYDKYYSAMANRLNYMRAIDCQTPDGLLTLKYWLVDHLENAAVGGVANFYGNYFTPNKTLPAGTPEAGKAVITSWGSSPSHTWTICGYNDSIRYDYNGDGQYTNTIDLNSDGIIDMHDWEKGGLKFANGYAGTGWGNQGYCYMMYKTLADAIGYGGIWNHRAYIIDVKQTTGVKLTMKITLKHTSRNKLKVTTGISSNLSATVPDYTHEYPIFRFQGGDLYMQGGSAEADKTLEFGLDLAPLLNQVTSGVPAKFFLQVQEVDPSGTATGEVVSWSLMDYTTGPTPVVTAYPTGNTPIANNTTTRMSLTYTPVFNRPDITTPALPPANLYQPYSFQLAAANGVVPYLWDLKLDYPETITTAGFPNITAQQLTVTNNNTGYAVKNLPFTFPYYKQGMNKLYIYTDGYILFDNQPYTWPYLVDKNNLFRQTAIICPFMTDLILYSSQSDGIWYEEDANSVTIRWKASIYNQQGTSGLNFAVKLYRSGKIEFYYGNMIYPASTTWTGGLSGGDNKNYQLSAISGAGSILTGTFAEWAACGFPVEMSLSDDGLFTGVPQNVYTNQQIRFRVTDNNNFQNTKILNFNTNGLLVDYNIMSGTDSIIEFGETTYITMRIRNIGNAVVHNVNTWITETDPYITLVDSTAYAGDIQPGQQVVLTNAFALGVSPVIPDNHPFTLVLNVSSTEHNFVKNIDLTAYAPKITAGLIRVDDGDNGRLDPGETSDITVLYRNTGGAKAQNLVITTTPADPALTINSSVASIPVLHPDSAITATFNISATPYVPFEHLYRMNSALTASNGFSGTDSLFLFSGEIIEDFESGTTTKFPWYFGGFGFWYTDPNEYYEGAFSCRSGWIYDNYESSLNISVKVLSEGDITFWKKVSCENDPNGTNYDWLGFFIDNTEMGRWDGVIGWSRETYHVTPGYHTFKWVYHKDYSVSANADASWIDFITFPPFDGGWPVIEASPVSFEKSINVGESADDILTVFNTGGGIMDFNVLIFDTVANKKSSQAPLNLAGSYIECYTDGFVPGQAFTWTYVVHNNSADNENIREIKIDFPYQVNVTSSTSFTGGSLGDLLSNGMTGPGANITWHGETTGGLGVVKPGETATTVISGTVDENYTDDAFIVYSIRGDSTGADPHNPAAHIRLKNFSLPNGWLQLTGNMGSIMHGNSAGVSLHFDAAGLPAPSDQTCNVVARDKYNNKITIPVVMHVLDTTVINGTGGNHALRMRCYPNPFENNLTISYTLGERQTVDAVVLDCTGKRVRHLGGKEQENGNYRMQWDGKDDRGNESPAGVYVLKFRAGETSTTTKIIRIH